MDIGNLSSYSDYVSGMARQQGASKLKETMDRLASSRETSEETSAKTVKKGSQTPQTEEEQELLGACKKFEAYFLEQIFKEMEKTVPKSEFSSGSTSQLVDYFKDDAIQKLAEQSTETRGLGLAEKLYEQMKRNYNL